MKSSVAGTAHSANADTRELTPKSMMVLVLAPCLLGGLLLGIGAATGTRAVMLVGLLLLFLSAMALASVVVMIFGALDHIRRMLADRAAEDRRDRLSRRMPHTGVF